MWIALITNKRRADWAAGKGQTRNLFKAKILRSLTVKSVENELRHEEDGGRMIILPFWIANWDKKNDYAELLPRHFTVWQPCSHSELGHLDKYLSSGLIPAPGSPFAFPRGTLLNNHLELKVSDLCPNHLVSKKCFYLAGWWPGTVGCPSPSSWHPPHSPDSGICK